MKIEGWGFDAAFLQLAEDSHGIVAPLASSVGTIVAAECKGLWKEFTGETIKAIFAWGDGGLRDEGNRHREHQTAGIVCVLTQQIDAGWRNAFEGPARC